MTALKPDTPHLRRALARSQRAKARATLTACSPLLTRWFYFPDCAGRYDGSIMNRVSRALLKVLRFFSGLSMAAIFSNYTEPLASVSSKSAVPK
jgi:hypothetical protein